MSVTFRSGAALVVADLLLNCLQSIILTAYVMLVLFSVILVSQIILVLVSVSGLFFVHNIKFLPQCQLLRNHCTIQKIAHAQYGNVSQSATKITSAATLLQYFRLRRHHGNKSKTAWFISRNTWRSSVVVVQFHFLVVRSLHTLYTRSAYASEAGA